MENNVFGNKIKFLRKSNLLSTPVMAMLLDYKHRSSIVQMEHGDISPTFEKLTDIANLYGVKIDWLFGRSDEPYDAAIILKLEESLMDIKIADNTVFKDIGPDTYLSSSLRKLNFSLSERARLIFLLKFFKTVTEKQPELLHKNVDAAFLKCMVAQKYKAKNWSKKPDELYMQLLHFIAVEIYK